MSAPQPAARGIVLPDRIATGDDAWRALAPVEFFVDFETVSSINDRFRDVRRQGGRAMIFQVGCAWRDPRSRRVLFRQWTTDRLTEREEARVISEWVAAMAGVARAAGVPLERCRVVHWSAAETAFLDNAYNSARARLGGRAAWPDLPWFDFLARVVRPAPVTVRGAMGFGLKAVAKAMHRAGLIATVWKDGPADGLGAMTGAWWCDEEAARLGCAMGDLALMREIAAYNRVDCEAMLEIVEWLRANR